MNDALNDPEVRKVYEEEVLYGEAVETIGALVAGANLTQRDLAERLGVSEARVSQILAGGVNLTLRSLAHIGWALGIRFELDPVPMTKLERVGTPSVEDPPAPEWVTRLGRTARVVHRAQRIEIPASPVRVAPPSPPEPTSEVCHNDRQLAFAA